MKNNKEEGIFTGSVFKIGELVSFDPFIDIPSENYNSIVFGKPGKGRKVATFKKVNFKKELAPKNANIEDIEINGERFVRITY